LSEKSHFFPPRDWAAIRQIVADAAKLTSKPWANGPFFGLAASGPRASRALELAGADPDRQMLLCRYPAETRSRPADEPAYIRPVVRVEMGARSDHWPAVEALVPCFAAAEFPGAFTETACTVKVLAAAGNDLR
jgi:hypothetical protein